MKKRTDFLKQINSENAELFLTVRDYIKITIGNDVKEVQNKCSTTYRIKEGVFCSLCAKGDGLFIKWQKANMIDEKYKIQEISSLNTTTREIIRYLVKETYPILFEQYALKYL